MQKMKPDRVMSGLCRASIAHSVTMMIQRSQCAAGQRQAAGVSRHQSPWGVCVAAGAVQRRPRTTLCRAETEGGKEQAVASTSTSDDDVMSRTEVQKLAGLRKEQQRAQSQSNIVQGALEEAQLITWPTPQKALFDTVLVLGIVMASGSLLFGLNVLLAEASDFWYHL